MIFGALLLVVQVTLGLWTEASFPELSRLDHYLAERADVIYFGDSTSFFYATTDRTRRGIPELLQERLPGHSIRAVDHSAYHLGLYRAFCEYIRRAGGAPRVIIVSLNLGWLSAALLDRPEHQLVKESIILEYRTRHYDSRFKRALLQPLLVFKAFALRPAPYDGEPAPAEARAASGPDAWDVSDEDVKRRLSRYMYSLDEEHPRIKDMVGIMRTFEGSATRLVFYLTPIDYETGEDLVGSAFSERIREKGELIRRLTAERGAWLSDLSLSLTASDFGWRGERGNQGLVLNEHLVERGRQYVAERLAESVEQQLRD